MNCLLNVLSSDSQPNLKSCQSEQECVLENLELVRIHDKDEILGLIDVLAKMLQILDVWFLRIWQLSGKLLDWAFDVVSWVETSRPICPLQHDAENESSDHTYTSLDPLWESPENLDTICGDSGDVKQTKQIVI